MADRQDDQLSLVGAASSNFNSILDGGDRYLQQLEGQLPSDDTEFRIILPKNSHTGLNRLPSPLLFLQDFDMTPWKMSLLRNVAVSEQANPEDFVLRFDMVVALETGVSCVKLIDKESETEKQSLVNHFESFRNAVQAVFPSVTWPMRLVFMQEGAACTTTDSVIWVKDQSSLELAVLQGETKAARADFRKFCSLLVGLWSAIRTSSRKVVDMYDMTAYTIDSLNLDTITLSELKLKCEEYTNAVCPLWNSKDCQHVYLVPPIFKIEFAEPVGQGSGAIVADSAALKKIKGLERYAGDLAEYEVYKNLEKSGTIWKTPFVSIHGFKWNETKAKAFSALLPKTAERVQYFEADVIIVHKAVGVIIIEIKACIDNQPNQPVLTALRDALKTKKDDSSDTIRKKYQEAKKQLNTDAEFIRLLAEEAGVSLQPSQIKKVVCFPFVSMEHLCQFCCIDSEQLQQDGFYICTANNFNDNFDSWLSNLVYQDGHLDDGDIRSLLNNLPAAVCQVKQDSTEVYEGLVPLLLAINAYSVNKQSGHGVMQDASKSTAYASVSTRIKGHKIVLGNTQYSGLVKTKKEARVFHDDSNYVFMLTPDQMAVWKGASNWQIICGAAGTGKTVLTLGKILHLVRERRQQAVALVPFPANKKYEAVLKSAGDLVQVYEPNSLLEQLALLKACVQGEPGCASFAMKHLFSKLYSSVHCIIARRRVDVRDYESLKFLPSLYKAIDDVDYANLMHHFGSQIPRCEELVNEMETLLRHKFLFTDDSLTLTNNNLLFIIAYLIGCITARSADSIAGCWISYDPKQTMPRAEGLQCEIKKWTQLSVNAILNGSATGNNLSLISADVRSLYTYATARMYTAALHFHNLKEFTNQSKECFKRIDTVMRCGSNLFRYWYELCLMENTEISKLSENVWLSSKAYAGHNVTGSEIRSFSLSLEEFLGSGRKLTSIKQLTKQQRRLVASHLAMKIYEYVVIIKGRYASPSSSCSDGVPESSAASTHAVETAAKLQLKDFVVLLDPDMLCLMQDLRELCSSTFESRLKGSKVSDISDQLDESNAQRDDCFAIDSVANCVSLEWPVVFFISCDLEQSDTENWNVFVDYFALSRAICTQVWMHVL